MWDATLMPDSFQSLSLMLLMASAFMVPTLLNAWLAAGRYTLATAAVASIGVSHGVLGAGHGFELPPVVYGALHAAIVGAAALGYRWAAKRGWS